MALQIILKPDLLDQLHLRLERVDVLFLALHNVDQQVSRDIVLDLFTVTDGVLKVFSSGQLKRQVALQSFSDVLTDKDLVEILEIRQTFEKQDAVDQAIRMLHLIDRFLVLDLVEFLESPILEHASVQEVLVYRGQFICENGIEVFDDPLIALHGLSSVMLLNPTFPR